MTADDQSVYPLTPTQQGMLFHHLSRPGSGVDIEQIRCTLHEPLDAERFQQAWQECLARHPALRSRFLWDDVDDPAQEVVGDSFVPIRVEDWRQRSTADQERAIGALLDEERSRDFDLREAPAMRLVAIRVEDAKWEVLWTFHHIICDGRSFPRVLGEVFAFYDGNTDNVESDWPRGPSFADHVRHVLGLDLASAERFWKERLSGFAQPTELPAAGAATMADGRGHLTCQLNRGTSDSLREYCAEMDVSLNTLLQGAWALLLGRWSGADDVVFGATRAGRAGSVADADRIVGCLINTLPVRVHLDAGGTVGEWLRELRQREREVRPYDQSSLMSIQAWSDVGAGQPLFESLIVFDHQILDSQMKALGKQFDQRHFELIERTNYPLTLYAYDEPEIVLKLAYDEPRFSHDMARAITDTLSHLLTALAEHSEATLDLVDWLPSWMREQLLHAWNDTAVDFPETLCVHQSFEAVAARSPDATALVFRDQSIRYGELNRRANQLAYTLLGLGVGPDVPVALCVDRGPDMMVALLAILKAGGCYLPLDPDYPRDRLAFMLADALPPVVLTQSHLEPLLPKHSGRLVLVDDPDVYAGRPENDPPGRLSPSNLAYVIYTSGSTGKPKGVMVEHRQVQNFFTAMDARIPNEPKPDGSPGTWLAVTSLSFDISVLELFWTLGRGFSVVLHEDQQRAAMSAARRSKHPDRAIGFSLMYFSSADTASEDRYRLLIEGAKFADSHGFDAVWTPERHFHEFGGLFPNPSLTTAALAMVTNRVALRAGSVVGPLHHPARIAEEWALADNLSGGRVGVAFASGWQPRDFVLAPEAFGRKELMLEAIDKVNALWKGEEVEFSGPEGSVHPVRTLPRPVQASLPIWLTAAGSPETFREAGRRGAGVLTHFLGQSRQELAEKIASYRQAWADAGHPGNGHVTLMLHTFIGDSVDEVREIVRRPMMNYLGSSLSLVKGFASTWTAFKKRSDGTTNVDIDLDSLTEEEMEGLLEYSFERYFETAGLFGDVDRALEIVDDLKELGIDEIACLIDFGVDEDRTLEQLQQLNQVKDLSRPAAQGSDATQTKRDSLPDQIRRFDVTHLQCTPSLASMVLETDGGQEALGALKVMLVGGEAFPPSLASQLRDVGIGTILNMYGPTETTIWSTVHELSADASGVPIGTPIANTRVYVLDKNMCLVPPGVAGELFIGGDGVTRGYLGRDELTAERFVDDPFGTPGDRLYRTGDLVKWRHDGILEFLGRIDHQVKIRGHRIELGEIESALVAHDGVSAAVVLAREDRPGDVRLVAYFIATDKGAVPSNQDLKAHLRSVLPEPMVPSHLVVMDQFPQTPNRKIDRKALPAPASVARKPNAAAGSVRGEAGEIESKVMAVWCEALQLSTIGLDDNFFDIGGHSLLAVKVHRQLARKFDQPLGITDLFRFPTIRTLSEFLGGGSSEGTVQESQARGELRRQALASRRQRRSPTKPATD